jgi:CRP/FNR family transcriptional regulator, cyclic AMP receptor protein
LPCCLDARSRIPSTFRDSAYGDASGVNAAREKNSYGYEACLEFSTLHVDNRIQAEVLRLATLAGRVGNGARIVPAPTHVEIASRVSTHREAVTRELNRLARIGLVTRSGDALLVGDVQRLAQMVQDATGE